MSCGCGRSPDFCRGWHSLSEEEWQKELAEWQTHNQYDKPIANNHSVVVTEVHHYTDKLFRFQTTKPNGYMFKAGEFVMIGLGDKTKRAYSITSSPTDDFLEFYIDNQSQNINLHGDSDWQEFSVNVPVGTHLLSWVYQKDNSQSSGEDCAWVDLIQFPPGAVSPLNIDFGDLNSDNIINILDVIVTVNYLIGYLEFDQEQTQNADMNLDGTVSINDILMIVESVLAE